ncbi:hypothetical protein BESB_075280 [Besnoitia besnoiti]|uniref:Uncharacterized protein n=1 Tax=Besnoitia besnoiti TaxID=94643 RepID=A0A2A9MEL5_BESBE|nr:uncharacterized protein BESB_075280 [Besnoitia besnoiti]PFH34376.1 hypothetical protein BESB_075280 [Besnoitia besnoiti]
MQARPRLASSSPFLGFSFRGCGFFSRVFLLLARLSLLESVSSSLHSAEALAGSSPRGYRTVAFSPRLFPSLSVKTPLAMHSPLRGSLFSASLSPSSSPSPSCAGRSADRATGPASASALARTAANGAAGREEDAGREDDAAGVSSLRRKREWNARGSPRFLAPSFIASSDSPVTEDSLVGEWELEATLNEAVPQLAAKLLASQGGDSEGDGRASQSWFSGLFSWGTAAEKTRRRRTREEEEEGARLLQALEALAASGRGRTPAALPRPPLRLTLKANREGLLHAASAPGGDGFFPAAVWQLKRRPFSALHVEIEVPFPPSDPRFILVFVAPAQPSSFFPASVRIGEGRLFVAVAPFLPWSTMELGVFSIRPKTLKAIVDPSLL